MGTQPLPKKGGSPPIFHPCLLRPNGCMDQDATWYGNRPRPKRHCVKWGRSYPSPKRGRSSLPNFGPMSIVAKQLDGSRWHLAWRWALSRPHCARWGPSSQSAKKEDTPPIFGPCLLWPNIWMHQDTTWYGGRPHLRRHFVRCGPNTPPLKEHSAKFVYCGQTAG